MVGVFVVDAGVVFNSDLFSPNTLPSGAQLPPGPGRDQAQNLLDALSGRGLNATTVAGGHGFGVATIDDVRAAVGL